MYEPRTEEIENSRASSTGRQSNLSPLNDPNAGIEKQIRAKLGNPIDSNGNRRTAIVMVANEGVMDLLLNWLCSANAVNLDMSTVIIYVGTVESVAVVEVC